MLQHSLAGDKDEEAEVETDDLSNKIRRTMKKTPNFIAEAENTTAPLLTHSLTHSLSLLIIYQ